MSVNDKAVHEYQLVRYYWMERTKRNLKTTQVVDNLKKAIKHFDQAIKYDKKYAHAYSGLADVYLILPFYSNKHKKNVCEKKARKAINDAKKYNKNLAEVCTSSGHLKEFYDNDYKGAKKEYERAIVLNPRYAHAHYRYSYLLTLLGRLTDSIAAAKRAISREPNSAFYHVELGCLYTFKFNINKVRYKNYANMAIEEYKEANILDSNNSDARLWLTITYISMKKFVDAGKALSKWAKIVGLKESLALLFVSKVKEHNRTKKGVTPPKKLVAILEPLGWKKPLYAYLGNDKDTIAMFKEEGGSLRYMRYFPAYDNIRSGLRIK